jgi:hypothetical protein
MRTRKAAVRSLLSLCFWLAAALAIGPSAAAQGLWPIAGAAPHPGSTAARPAPRAVEAPISAPQPQAAPEGNGLRPSLPANDGPARMALPSKKEPPPPLLRDEDQGLAMPAVMHPSATVMPGERPRIPEPDLITGSVPQQSLKLGTFTIRPAIEVDVGYDTNPRRFPQILAKGSSFISPAFRFDAESNWDANALTLHLRGRLFSYQQIESANRFDGVADATYRYDINDTTWLFLNARAAALSEQSAENIVLAAPDATVNEIWASARLLKKFGQFFTSLGLWEGFTDVAQTPGRSYTTTLGALRAGYEVNANFTPYAEIQLDRRLYEAAWLNNIERSSAGIQPTFGMSYRFNDTLTTEGFAGYLWRDYDNALVATTQWPVFGLQANWQFMPQASLQGRIRTGINETTVGGAFGAKENIIGMTYRQKLGPRLALFANLDLSQADYIGIPGNQKRALGEIGAEYALTHALVARLSAQRDVMTSTYQFNSYEANIFMAGLKVVR